jgi:hypothetical protein
MGVGQGKQKYLKAELGEEALDAMRALKKALDPQNVFNPGKIVSRQKFWFRVARFDPRHHLRARETKKSRAAEAPGHALEFAAKDALAAKKAQGVKLGNPRPDGMSMSRAT